MNDILRCHRLSKGFHYYSVKCPPGPQHQQGPVTAAINRSIIAASSSNSSSASWDAAAAFNITASHAHIIARPQISGTSQTPVNVVWILRTCSESSQECILFRLLTGSLSQHSAGVAAHRVQGLCAQHGDRPASGLPQYCGK